MPEVQLSPLAQKFQNLEQQLNGQIKERHDVVHGLMIALLAKKHLLMLGPPGTAKSLAAREISSRIQGCNYFEYLLTRFTTPDELFGPFSMRALEEDRYYRITQGKLPNAHIAFIDEVYKGSSAIANTLLTLINERLFHNDGAASPVPLQTLVAASNELPAESEELAAFHDRFLLKYEVQYIVERGSFTLMLQGSKDLPESEKIKFSMEELGQAQKEAMEVQVTGEVHNLINKVRFELQKEGVVVSDRVFNTSQDLVKAESWLMGMKQTPAEALAICQHAYWDEPKKMRDVKMTVLRASSKELLAIEKAYEQASELIRPKTSLDDETSEIKESLETRKKLAKVVKVLDENIKALEKKNLPVFKYKTMLEAAKHRLQDISGELLGEEMDAILQDSAKNAKKKGK